MSGRLLRAVVAAAALEFAAPAAAFVRLTTVSLQPDKGLCLWWRPRGITYVVNMSAFTGLGCASGSAASQVARSSFPAWMHATRAGDTSPCTDFVFTHGGESTSTELGYDQAPGATNTNLVVVRKGQCPSVVPAGDPCSATFGACAAKYNCWEHGSPGLTASALALTTLTFNVNTGEILDADMELNGWDGSTAAPQDGSGGWYFTCGGSGTCGNPPYGQAGCNWIDAAGTVTHEAGHMLGLDHVCVSSYPAPYNACPSPTPVMAPSVVFGETWKRLLSPDDVEGACTIYPAGSATKTCLSSGTGTQPSGKGGCSTGEGGVAALAAALLVLALRRQLLQLT